MISKYFRKIIRQLLLIFYILKKKKYVQADISKFNLNYVKQITLLMIPNKEKEGQLYLAVKKNLHY